jgi:hypothetical protein
VSPAEPGQTAATGKISILTPKLGMIVLILAPAVGASVIYYFDGEKNAQVWLKVCAVIVLSLFLPLLAYSYYFFRKERRAGEIDRIITKLEFDESRYVEMFRSIHSGPYFIIAVGMAWAISLAGLTILFFGDAIGIIDNPGVLDFPKTGSRLVFGMAFLGAYFWGLKYVFRRYVLNDLIPGVFFRLSIRMLVASTLAVIIFNAFESLAGEMNETFKSGAWPALAFLLGAFPQRGQLWLMAKVPIFSDPSDPSVRNLPLEMIEGVDAYDRLRLEEIGIDNCYDLATYDFIPLMLKTSYDARKLVDWILQAKLCVRCGAAIATLRQQGIRGIHDLAELKTDNEIEALANETTATLSSLKRAQSIAVNDVEIERLLKVAGRLSKYTKTVVREDPDLQGKTE